MMSPSQSSLYALAALSVFALVLSLAGGDFAWWSMALGAVLGLLGFDALLSLLHPKWKVARELPSAFIVGLPQPVKLTLHNRSSRHLQLIIYDHLPDTFSWEYLPQHIHLDKQSYAVLEYQATPQRRGHYRLRQLQIRYASPLKFWWRDVYPELISETRVYPNYTSISQYALLGADRQLGQMGIIKKQRRGEGQDFLQLREYREGDSQRQIDWKATSRMQKIISREYQDERDQEILFLLDCGHRMLAQDAMLSHFDHTLNAILLLSHIALKQGDAVGFGAFAGQERWLKPQKGQYGLQQILNRIYDLQPQYNAPDYLQMATETLIRQKKRSLIIIISNLRDEDIGDLLPAMQLLRKRHVVLMASMRETALDHALTNEIDGVEQAVRYAAICHYLSQRQAMIKRLQTLGINALDVPPTELSTNLINHYFNIKRSQML